MNVERQTVLRRNPNIGGSGVYQMFRTMNLCKNTQLRRPIKQESKRVLVSRLPRRK